MTTIISALVLVVALSLVQGSRIAPVYRPKPAYRPAYPKYEPRCQVHAFGQSLTDDGVDVDDKHGFRLFTNGPNWVNHFARLIGCGDEAVRNYAYSGALSDTDNTYFKGWSGTDWQVETYLKFDLPRIYAYGYPHIVVAFEAGGFNDFYKLVLDTPLGNELGFKNIREALVNSTAKSLRKLMRSGLYTFVVLDVFEPTPEAPGWQVGDHLNSQALVPPTIRAINEQLGEKIEQLRREYPGFRIVHVKTKGMSRELKDKFSAGGKAFTHHKSDTYFKEWEKYAWYDQFHPTTAVHKLIAERAFEAYTQRTYVEPTKPQA